MSRDFHIAVFVSFECVRLGGISRPRMLLEQDAKISREWRDEFVAVFTPENRAKFPSNRDYLRPHAENLIRLLKQRVILNNGAAARFDQAAAISKLLKEKKCITVMAESFRKDVEINLLFIDQMKLVVDDEIRDQKTFDSEFMTLTDSIADKVKESEDLQTAARACLGAKPLPSLP